MTLNHSLNIGSQSLYASQQGINTTAHNIANAQTEGYSRQRVSLTQRDPLQKGGVLLGNGVFVGSIDRLHDKLVEKQVNLAQTDVGSSAARGEALSSLEAIYSPEQGTNLADHLNNFFSACQNLSRYPEELSVRTQVREQGETLSQAFRSVDGELRRQRQSFDDHINLTTIKINNQLETIAQLNGQIRVMEPGMRNNANDLRDQRDRLVHDLSALTNINYYEDKDGMVTIRGPGDTLLVDRVFASKLEVQQNGENEGLNDILLVDSEGSSSRNITSIVTGGKLAGLLDVRDKVCRNLLDHNNNMVNTLVGHFNAVHQEGYGVEEYRDFNGRSFFEDVKDPRFAAQNMKLDLSVMTSTDAISAGSVANTIGDNVIANRLARLQVNPVLVDERLSLSEYYAEFVGGLGMDTLRGSQIHDASNIILSDLQSRRESISGVSLDEEATNLIRWQTAFTASSKVITTIDEMFDTVLGLKR